MLSCNYIMQFYYACLSCNFIMQVLVDNINSGVEFDIL